MSENQGRSSDPLLAFVRNIIRATSRLERSIRKEDIRRALIQAYMLSGMIRDVLHELEQSYRASPYNMDNPYDL